ncbi:hypothetical protein HDV00_006304 [Rhizophlyctis rosea]|nr:hypothetical protein HDV00_006304 [Rhizophlyctis rosea]
MAPPVGYEFLTVYNYTLTLYGAIGWRRYPQYYSVARFQKYPGFNFFIKTNTVVTGKNSTGQPNAWGQIPSWGFSMRYRKNGSTYSSFTQLSSLMTGNYAGNSTTTSDGWTQYFIPEQRWRSLNTVDSDFDIVELQMWYNTPQWDSTTTSTNQQIAFCGYFGYADGVPKPIGPPVAPAFPIPNDIPFEYTTKAIFPGGAIGNQTFWICPDNMPVIEYPDLASVNVQAWRDTNISIPVPMDMSTAGYTNGFYNFVAMYESNTRRVDAYLWPHPGYICGMPNADYIEIGNLTQAGPDNLIVVWAPETSADVAHLLAAFSYYVLNTRNNGTDTVAFHVRTRVNPFYGREYAWIQLADQICSDSVLKNVNNTRWQCPDLILFKDEQMGWLKTGKDALISLAGLERAYFKQTGFMASLQILPMLSRYTVYSEANYAVPYAVNFEPWVVNGATLTALGLPMPPTGSNANTWGTAWWETWNITTLNTYIDKMYYAGYSNLLPLPCEDGGETKFATYLGFSFGASVLNADGRCGLDDSMVKALNNTIVRWRQMSNWTYGIASPLYSKNGTKFTPGVLPWREEYPSSIPQPTLYEWLNTPPLDDPFKEPLFTFKDPTNFPYPYALQTFSGFAMKTGYGPTYTRIYPPTGAGYMGAKLLGVAKSSRNTTRAYDALMVSFARHKRFQVNCPSMYSNNAGGVSGYQGVTSISEWAFTGKSFYDGLIDHTVAVGTPAAQGMSYGQIALRNPMQMAFNDILYKNMSIAAALDRACVIINATTKPPCQTSDLVPYLVDDVTANAATLQFKWKDNRDCNENLPNSAAIPAPLTGAVSTAYVSTESGLAKAMMALAAACMIIIFLLFLMFQHKRNTPPIRAASRVFSNLILIGGEITLASVIMRTSSNTDIGWIQCFGTYWFFALGYGLVMGSLLVKTYRVDRIFRNKKMGFSLPDIQLVGYVFFIELVEVAFLLVGTLCTSDDDDLTSLLTIFRPKVLQFRLDESSYYQQIHIPLTEYYVTQNVCPKSNQVGSILLYIWNAIIILFAAIYAMRTRKVQSAYNENIFTVAAIALISVLSIVIVPVLTIINSSNAVFLMVSIGTIVGTTASVLVFAIPKLMLAYEIVSFKQALQAATTRAAAMTTSSGEGSGKDGSRSMGGTAAKSEDGAKRSAGNLMSVKSNRTQGRDV